MRAELVHGVGFVGQGRRLELVDPLSDRTQGHERRITRVKATNPTAVAHGAIVGAVMATRQASAPVAQTLDAHRLPADDSHIAQTHGRIAAEELWGSTRHQTSGCCCVRAVPFESTATRSQPDPATG